MGAISLQGDRAVGGTLSAATPQPPTQPLAGHSPICLSILGSAELPQDGGTGHFGAVRPSWSRHGAAVGRSGAPHGWHRLPPSVCSSLLLSPQGGRRDVGGNCLKVRGVTPLRVSRR